MRKFVFLSLGIFFAACNNSNTPDHDDSVVPPKVPPPQIINFNIISQYPHDNAAYTQGLQYYNNKMYEGTGDYENSSLRITDLKTGKVEKKHSMGSKEIFGEGITIFRDKIYQLTWQSHIVYVYDINNIDKPVKTFNWPYDGWGITNNGKDLIVSDGTANIYFVDPETFTIKNTMQVKDNIGFIDSLNELEYINGYIYANVYLNDFIVKIDPATGYVVGKINLPGLIHQYAPDYKPGDGEVLNGIAWDSASKKMFITGKHWPKMFEGTLN